MKIVHRIVTFIQHIHAFCQDLQNDKIVALDKCQNRANKRADCEQNDFCTGRLLTQKEPLYLIIGVR